MGQFCVWAWLSLGYKLEKGQILLIPKGSLVPAQSVGVPDRTRDQVDVVGITVASEIQRQVRPRNSTRRMVVVMFGL